MGFLRRNLGKCLESIKELAYKSLVRPHLEYGSSVWDPWKEKQIKQIEAVQRRSARFVRNCWKREPGIVTNMLNDLDLLSLQTRRKQARLMMFHKAIHGESEMEFPNYIKRKNWQLRSYHKDKFIEMKSNTETNRNSFYCRTIN